MYRPIGELLQWLKNIEIAKPKNKDNHQIVETSLKRGTEDQDSFTVVSPDFSARDTWYQNAEKVTDEVLDTSDNLTYAADNAYWIDVDGEQEGHRGISYDYKGLIQKDGTFEPHTEYYVIVKVDDEVVTSGFTVDYDAGEITFDSSQSGSTVKATYYHTDDVTDRSQWVYSPGEGETILIQHVEMQFSTDLEFAMGDKIQFDIFAGADVATYEYLSWDRTHATCQEWSDYRSVNQLIDWCNNDYPCLKMSLSPEFTYDQFVFPFKYLLAPKLEQNATNGYPVIRISLANDTPLDCEKASITIYAVKSVS